MMDSLKVTGLGMDFVKMDISLNWKYNIWSRKVHYLLNSKKVDYILDAPEPIFAKESTKEEK